MEAVYDVFIKNVGMVNADIEIKTKLRNNIFYKILFLFLGMLRISGLGGCAGVDSASI